MAQTREHLVYMVSARAGLRFGLLRGRSPRPHPLTRSHVAGMMDAQRAATMRRGWERLSCAHRALFDDSDYINLLRRPHGSVLHQQAWIAASNGG
jgi:hypothetical protein